ncbi:MAG: 8-amino-7-oxononanoate synthase [Pirellulales bacterium]|nr:8-amino-7-oxononanoate synthase [Pirellulales bacterium]
MDPLNWIAEELAQLERSDLLRSVPPPLGVQGATVEQAGRRLINFASNDYLGLAADPRLTEAVIRACQQHGVGRGASPLVCGRSQLHDQLELRLAQFLQTEAALLFPTSFAANAGVIPALVDRGDAIYGDAKNHASIIDGCRLSRAERHIYSHADASALEQLLQTGAHYRRRLIVSDTLFSMDGDLAPLPELATLAEKYDAMLMLDETHAFGVFGSGGRGIVEHFAAAHPELSARVDVRVGTFGKALGVAGGFVCGSRGLVRWLANRARTYVFSTAHPAALSAAALAALDIVESDRQRPAALLAEAQALRGRLQQLGWDTGRSASQIIPLRVGAPRAALQISEQLRKRGLWLPAIRPPSVPPRESLLRLGLTAAHTGPMIETLVAALTEVESGNRDRQ